MGKLHFLTALLLAGLMLARCDPVTFDDEDEFDAYRANFQDIDDLPDNDNGDGLVDTAESQGIHIKNAEDDKGYDLLIRMGKKGGGGGGVTYVRWGRSECPQGAELVYSGRVGGSHYSHKGGGSNYQCLTMQPKNFDFGPGTAGDSYMYGTEYETNRKNTPKSGVALQNYEVPCAVCYVKKRAATLMIPGTYECPRSWTREYYGYLMSSYHGYHRTTFECVDKTPQGVGSVANHDGAQFFYVEPRCGSLQCPPYDQQKEMTCAVCTR